MRLFFVHMIEKTLRVEAVEPRPGLLLSSAFYFGEGFPINTGRSSKVTFGKL